MSWKTTLAAAAAAIAFAFFPAPPSARAQSNAAPVRTYVGSARCRTCHPDVYASWSRTRMANVVHDPKQFPDAVLGDFSHPDPVRTFDLGDVAFVYGSRWKQFYFARKGDGFYVLPAEWDIKNRKWIRFHMEKNQAWWVPFYPESNTERPTGPLCDGCHAVNYNPQTKQSAEENIGCEQCHGPGSAHAGAPSKENIVNPAKLDYVRGNDVCFQCHSEGRPLTNPTAGYYYEWPVGFVPGERLADYWQFEKSKLGEKDYYYLQDGTARKSRMQGNDFAQSVMYHRGVRCFDCHDPHSDRYESNLVAPAANNDLCLRCHGPETIQGPHLSIPEHTHHAAKSAGSQCIACHMPKIETTNPDSFLAAHTFRFVSPELTKQFGIPNPCNSCHADKDPDWALAQLKSWETESPWRVLQSR